MRVLVCGGRNYNDYEMVRKVLDAVDNVDLYHPGGDIIDTVISGHARGADTLGEEYAKANGIDIEVYPAQWNKYGKRAGYLRNTQMLEEGKPDLVVAFPGGVGTAMMCKIARNAGVKVMEITE